MGNKVLVGYITNEYARRADFYDYLNMMEYPPDCSILPSHNASPAAARNKLVQAALDTDMTHLLVIDDDHKLPANALKRLLAHDVDMITGLYVQRAWPHRPLIFDLVDEDGAALYSFLDEPPQFREVKNAGLGFCLFNMRVFKGMDKPWFRLGELDPEQWSDDIGFFNRAIKAGFKLFVDETVCIGHLGTMIVTPEWNEKEQKWYVNYNTDGMTEVRIPINVPVEKYEFK